MLSLNHHASVFIGSRSWYVQCFPYLGLAKKKPPLIFDIKFHDSYLMKCLHCSSTQNDTIWWHMYLPNLVSNDVETTSNQCYTQYVTLLRMLIHKEENLMASQFIQEKNPISMIDFIFKKKKFTRITPCQTYWLKLTILVSENSWPQRYC